MFLLLLFLVLAMREPKLDFKIEIKESKDSEIFEFIIYDSDGKELLTLGGYIEDKEKAILHQLVLAKLGHDVTFEVPSEVTFEVLSDATTKKPTFKLEIYNWGIDEVYNVQVTWLNKDKKETTEKYTAVMTKTYFYE